MSGALPNTLEADAASIRTRRQLEVILPTEVAERIHHSDGELLAEMQSAGALRILATVKNPVWWPYVEPTHIEWGALLTRVRREERESSSVRVRVEAAAGLAGCSGAKVDLLYLARALDRENLSAVLDAIRIVADGGLEP
jgi:hypothetical protein